VNAVTQHRRLANEGFANYHEIKEAPGLAHGDCLRLAIAAQAALSANRIRSVIVAGSARFWVHDTFNLEFRWDDSLNGTQLGIWAKHERMPEMHCWVKIPSTNMIMDLWPKYLQERLVAMNLDDKVAEPVDFLFKRLDQMPEAFEYKEHPVATEYARTMAASLTAKL